VGAHIIASPLKRIGVKIMDKKTFHFAFAFALIGLLLLILNILILNQAIFWYVSCGLFLVCIVFCIGGLYKTHKKEKSK
jgi:uncharacterized membrane protein